MTADLEMLRTRFQRDGFLAPISVVDEDTALLHRRRLEEAEEQVGPLHWRDKVHTILRSPWELATDSALLDAVEACIGPAILLYNVIYIIKEPHTPAHVTWHQDLTYWGLADDDAQVSAWIALAPATPESGCMRMIPGSHTGGRRDHATGDGDDANVLELGQHIDGIDEDTAVHVALRPGEASLHHGWTVHASAPNTGDDRRIGVNIQYLAPRNRQLAHDDDTALLVRGRDDFGHFGPDLLAEFDLEPAALERQRAHEARIKGTYKVIGAG